MAFEDKYESIFQSLSLKSRVKWQKNTLRLFVVAHICANNVFGLSEQHQVELHKEFHNIITFECKNKSCFISQVWKATKNDKTTLKLLVFAQIFANNVFDLSEQ